MNRHREPERKRPKNSAARLPIVLVFGEDDNDRESIKILLGALRPDLVGRIQTRRQPLVLIKSANPADVPERAQRIADVVEAERVRNDVGCVFAHEDCDDVEPAHERVALKIEQALRKAGCDAHAVAPAWEMEAWWFLWPEAVQKAFPSWRKPDDYVGKNVGMIRHAKEEFKKRVTPPRGKPGFRGYQESGSPKIASQVNVLGLADNPQATSGSYNRFRAGARGCLMATTGGASAQGTTSAGAPEASSATGPKTSEPNIIRASAPAPPNRRSHAPPTAGARARTKR